MSPEEEGSKSWLGKNTRNIFCLGVFLALIFLWVWMGAFRTETDLSLRYSEFPVPKNIITRDSVPDFKSWVIKKEGEIDADLDGKNDFKLRYYLKDQEDAIALFVPLKQYRSSFDLIKVETSERRGEDSIPPKLLIYAHYPNNKPDIFATGFYIGFGVFEDNKWTLVNFYINDKYARIVKEELKKIKIEMREVDLLVRIMKTNFNIRTPKINKKKEGEVFVL